MVAHRCAAGRVELLSLAAMLERTPEPVEALLCRRVSDYPSGFAALNTAFMADGAYIRLAAGTAPDKPIHLLFVATGRAGHPYAQSRDGGRRLPCLHCGAPRGCGGPRLFHQLRHRRRRRA
ncbi:hypothetical protein ACU4GD_31530 [Cupriavidus basilensis]